MRLGLRECGLVFEIRLDRPRTDLYLGIRVVGVHAGKVFWIYAVRCMRLGLRECGLRFQDTLAVGRAGLYLKIRLTWARAGSLDIYSV